MFRKHNGRNYTYKITPGKGSSFRPFRGIKAKGPDLGRIKDFFLYISGNISEFRTILVVVVCAFAAGFVIMLAVDFYHVRQLADFQPNVTTQI
ncbi:MAG: hypothetical protein ACRCUT_00795, partial [Spirochaetota bacterium]